MLLTPEDKLIPYQTASLPPGPWLVVAPHPDDETLGMGGTIIKASQADILVHLIVVSDGGRGGAWKLRQAEALLAAKVLGVKRIEFWNLPDREVQKNFCVFKQKFLNLNKFYRTIFLPSFFEFHPDHRATTMMALALLKKIDWKGEVWLYEISRQGEANRLVDISAVVDLKRRAIACYKSQLSQNDYEKVALGLNKARAYTLYHLGVEFAEAFFASPPGLLITEWFNQLKRYF